MNLCPKLQPKSKNRAKVGVILADLEMAPQVDVEPEKIDSKRHR
jgi:hypothetical protein